MYKNGKWTTASGLKSSEPNVYFTCASCNSGFSRALGWAMCQVCGEDVCRECINEDGECKKCRDEDQELLKLKKEIEILIWSLDNLQLRHKGITGKRHVMPIYTSTPKLFKKCK